MQVNWTHRFVLIAESSKDLMGLNHAYGTIIRGHGKKSWPQRYLLPTAKKYKEKWVAIFKLRDLLYRDIPKYHDSEERDKPLLALRFIWIYNDADYVYSTGRLRGIDVSNGPKLVEDAFSEYIGVDDSRTVFLECQKVRSDGPTQVVFEVGYIKGDIRMTDIAREDLPKLTAYAYLPKEAKAKVDSIVKNNCIGQESMEAMRMTLMEFGSAAAMIYTAVELMTQKGYLKAGVWDKLVRVMETIKDEVPAQEAAPPVSEIATSPPVDPPVGTQFVEETEENHEPRRAHSPKTQDVDFRGLLPFANLPPAKDKAAFLEKWLKKVSGKKIYPKGMIGSDGEINWDCPKIYEYSNGKAPCKIYRALLNSPQTYDALLAKLPAMSKEEVARVLKKIITDPSWLPPGAGEYCEDEKTGNIWISRDPKVALAETLPFMEV